VVHRTDLAKVIDAFLQLSFAKEAKEVKKEIY
jgi:hypothetical protein